MSADTTSPVTLRNKKHPPTFGQPLPANSSAMQDQINRGLGFDTVVGNPPGLSAVPSQPPGIAFSAQGAAMASAVNSRGNTPQPPMGTRHRPTSEIVAGQAVYRPDIPTPSQGHAMPHAAGATLQPYHNAQMHVLSPEAEVIDRWFDDLSHYDRTLEQMSHTKMDSAFLEELRAMVTWFQAISDCERTTAVYSLLHHLNPVQVRFFVTVLRQMTKADPLSSLMEGGAGNRGGAPQTTVRYPHDRPASTVHIDRTCSFVK